MFGPLRRLHFEAREPTFGSRKTPMLQAQTELVFETCGRVLCEHRIEPQTRTVIVHIMGE